MTKFTSENIRSRGNRSAKKLVKKTGRYSVSDTLGVIGFTILMFAFSIIGNL